MTETITDSARMGEIESILDLTIDWVASAGYDFRIIGDSNGNLIGAGFVKAETSMGFVFSTSDLTGIKN